jgi:hypothetical protein
MHASVSATANLESNRFLECNFVLKRQPHTCLHGCKEAAWMKCKKATFPVSFHPLVVAGGGSIGDEVGACQAQYPSPTSVPTQECCADWDA